MIISWMHQEYTVKLIKNEAEVIHSRLIEEDDQTIYVINVKNNVL